MQRLRLFLLPLFAGGIVAAGPSVSVNVSILTVPFVPSLVSWSDVANAGTSDWIAAVCLPSATYFWWAYTDGSATGSQPFSLFANGKSSNCDSIAVSYYSASAVNKAIATSSAIALAPMIQQVHLFPQTNASLMVVDFVSSSPAGGAAYCVYGTDAGMRQRVLATTVGYATIGNLSHARLSGLLPNTQYFYQCGDAGAKSEVLTFTAAPDTSSRPWTLAVWADFGVDDGFGLQQIMEDADAGAYDAILHSGDFAYNFESDESANGNFFMNRAQTYASRYPVAPSPGNHEVRFPPLFFLLLLPPPPSSSSSSSSFSSVYYYYFFLFLFYFCKLWFNPFFSFSPLSLTHLNPYIAVQGANNFTEYKIRHGGVAAFSNTGSALFYSFEVNSGTPQGVHIITFNSETYIDGGIEDMVNWIAADLATVDRARTPWVVAQR